MNTANAQSEIIAENLIEQFYTLIEGDPFPIMRLTEEIELKPAENRYLYIHFFDPENPNSLSEISALRRLYEKYNSLLTLLPFTSTRERKQVTSLEE